MSNLIGMPALSASQLHTLAMSPMHSALDAPPEPTPDIVKTYFLLVGNTLDTSYYQPPFFAYGFLPFTAFPSWTDVNDVPIDPSLNLYTDLSDVYTPNGATPVAWSGTGHVSQGSSSESSTESVTYPSGNYWRMIGLPARSTAPPIWQHNISHLNLTWAKDSQTDAAWSGHTTYFTSDNLTRALTNQWSAVGVFNSKLAEFLAQSWTPDKDNLAARLYNMHQTAWAAATPDTGVVSVDDSGDTPTSGQGWSGFHIVGGNIGVLAGSTDEAGAICGWRVDLSGGQYDFEGYTFTALRTAAYHANPAPQYYFVARITYGDYGTLNGSDAKPDAIEFVSDGLIAQYQWLGNVDNANAIPIGSESIPTGGLETNPNGHLRNCVLRVGVIGQNPNTWAAQFGLEMIYPAGTPRRA